MEHNTTAKKILLATSHSYLPQRCGGSESSIHDLCIALRDVGFDVSVFCALSYPLVRNWRHFPKAFINPSPLSYDEKQGYPVFRFRSPLEGVEKVVAAVRPDLAIINSGKPIALADKFIAQNVPTIIYIRDAFFRDLGSHVRQHPLVRFVTTSLDLSKQFKEGFGILPVAIPPIVQPELYRVEPERRNVTFVCPVRKKGLHIALQLAARRPDIPFVFVESWPVSVFMYLWRNNKLRKYKNITLLGNTHNMREVYRDAKIILVPTPKYEAWGRVVSEAQISGIPVLASKVGGLPESVGPGGILVDPDASIDNWNNALSRMWDDSVEYARLAELAKQYACRPEFQPHILADRLCAVIHELLNSVV